MKLNQHEIDLAIVKISQNNFLIQVVNIGERCIIIGDNCNILVY